MKMMLSKNYDKKKANFPCYISRKFDGVPVIFWLEDGELKHATRQGKQLESIPHIIEGVQHWLNNQNKKFEGFVLCGELYIDNLSFKDISGHVRRQKPCMDLKLMVFEKSLYLDYMDFCIACLTEDGQPIKEHMHYNIEMVSQIKIHTLDQLEQMLQSITSMQKDWEGIMIRHGEYESGKRSWNSMKYKVEPTVDLKVVGFEEAIDKHGEPKGMVGSVQCEYNGQIINVGPGKLTHVERIRLFKEPLLHYGRIAEVKYMKDDSYDALRQPTFQVWRDDKNEVNEEV